MTASRSGSRLAALFVGLFANLAQVAALRLFLGTFAGTELHLGLFLGIWLGGIAAGAALASLLRIPLPGLLTVLAASPILAMAFLLSNLWHLPTSQGLLIPIAHSLALMAGLLLPLALPIGAFIPSLLRFREMEQESLATPYAFEALGSFIGGLLLSIALGGLASPVQTLVALPLLGLLALLTLTRRRGVLSIPVLIWPLLSAFAAPPIEAAFERFCWNRLQPGTTLQSTLETPYQRIAIGDYEGQKSLVINGIFVDNWPDPVKAEERVHTFLTAISSPSSLLVIGTPGPDLIQELAKYRDLQVTLVDLDGHFQGLMGATYDPQQRSRLTTVSIDPRLFLRTATQTWDGILLLPSDPSSLADNRLFTREAFVQMACRLNPGGVVGFNLAGSENYLGEELQETLLSTWHTLSSVFPAVFSLPGDPVQFWASPTPGALATDPAVLADRFSRRAIPTVSFLGAAFANRLLPFRVQELQSWLQRPVPVAVNADAHPKAFHRQLQLWDIYSDSRLGPVLKFLSKIELGKTLAASSVLLLLAAIGFALFGRMSGGTSLFCLSAGISGGVSLLGELGLLYLFQNREGAMIQQAALFFGIYMAGLAVGAYSGNRHPGSLFVLKSTQALAFGLGAVLARTPDWNGLLPVAAGVFAISFLAGRELPLLERRLKQNAGLDSGSSAGLLFWADNLGGMAAAVLAGPWLFPILGIEGAFILATALLTGNALLLLQDMRLRR